MKLRKILLLLLLSSSVETVLSAFMYTQIQKIAAAVMNTNLFFAKTVVDAEM